MKKSWNKIEVLNHFIVLLLISCSGVSKPSEKKVTTTFEEEGKRVESDLKVVFTAPHGTVSGKQQIHVGFSSPVKRLATAESEPLIDGKTPFIIQPPVEGSFRWLGSTVVAFYPSKPLPMATSFEITVPAGIKSLTGKVLKEPFKWKFETERPAVEYSEPGDGYNWAIPEEEVKICFNQSIEPAVLKSHTKIFSDNEEMDFIAFRGDEKLKKEMSCSGDLIVLKPKTTFKKGSSVRVVIDSKLTGNEGPLEVNKKWELKFSVYSKFVFSNLNCGDENRENSEILCYPDDKPRIKFSNRIDEKNIGKLISVSPRVKKFSLEVDDEYVYISGLWEPDTTYRISFNEDLKDEFGQKLEGIRDVVFRTRDYEPYWDFKFTGSVFENNFKPEVSVAVLNYTGIEGFVLKLTDEKEIIEILRKYNNGGWSSHDEFENFLKSHPSSIPLSVDTSRKRNRVQYVSIDLTGGKHFDNPNGFYFLSLAARQDKNKPDYYVTRPIRVTDIGITSKTSKDSILVWATSLRSGKPVSNADVRVVNRDGEVLWTGRTDDEGVALIDVKSVRAWSMGGSSEDDCSYIFVKTKDDLNYIDRCGSDSISPWQFDAPYSDSAGDSRLLGTIITDRGVYRPGESVKIKGYLRVLEKGKLKIPRDEDFDIKILDSRNSAVFKGNVKVTPFGSVTSEFRIPPSARTGYYKIEVFREDKWLSGSFLVEEYRAPNFKVSIDLPKKEFIRGERVSFSMNGEYLFGGEMEGSPVRWRLWCGESLGAFSPDGFGDYSFGDIESWWWRKKVSPSFSGDGVLGTDGIFLKEIESDFPEGESKAFSCTVEGTVEGPDKQRISSRSRFLVFPADFYPGLGLEKKVVSAGENISVRVVAVSIEKKELVENKDIKVTLERRTWELHHTEGMEEDDYRDYEPSYKKISSCSVKSSKNPVLCKFKIPRGGEYVIRAEGIDAKGRRAVSSTELWSEGSGEDISWRDSGDVSMKLESDKKIYNVGDIAKIIVKSPFSPAYALYTYERETVLKHFTKKLENKASVFEIPITEEMIPNIYVSVVVERGRIKPPPPKGGRDPGKPSVKIGYLSLNVAPGKNLDVKLTVPRKEYRPRDKVEMGIEVKGEDGKGRRSEVALFVVDEAVLMLTGFTLPDLIEIFYGQRFLGVENSDNRVSIFQRLMKFEMIKGEEIGGGGGSEEEMAGGSGEGIRRLFETTIFFAPEIITKDDGKSSVSFSLPDNLTTFTAFAVAQTEDSSFGKGKTSFVVTKPLGLTNAMPRFARVGDSFDAGVVIHNRTASKMDLKVKGDVKGGKINGESVKRITISANSSIKVPFRFETPDSGNMVSRFFAEREDGKVEDSIEITIPVKPPWITEVMALYGSTDTGAKESIAKLSDVRKDVGGIDFRISGTALVSIDESIDALLKYPYGCSEQLTSRLLPMIALEEIAKEYGLDIKIERKKLEDVVTKLQKFQHSSGGWGFFSDDRCPNPWLSAYVTWGLLQAKRRGFSVDDVVFERATDFLSKVLKEESRTEDNWYYDSWCPYIPDWWRHVSLPTKSFAAYVLADMGKADKFYNGYLYEHREKLPLFAKVLLMEAIYLQESGGKSGELKKLDKTTREMVEQLLQEVLSGVKQTPSSAYVSENLGDYYQYIFQSDIRDTAMTLSALLKIDPQHFLVPKMLKFLLDKRRKDGTWLTTQNNAYALLAISDYWRTIEPFAPDFTAKVKLGKDEVLSHSFKGRELKYFSKEFPMSDFIEKLPVEVLFDKNGPGKLYYAMVLSYAPKNFPEEPVDNGMYIEREYFSLDDFSQKSAESLSRSLSEVKAGTNVVVHLTVVAPQNYEFVVIDDPIPAGFEVLSENFKTTSYADIESLDKSKRTYCGNSENEWCFNPFYHKEIYDDRVIAFADSLSPGIYHYYYLVRATSKGKFIVPPAMVQEMYEPEVFGRTGYTMFEIK